MKRLSYFLLLLMLLTAINQIFAQIDGMSKEELRQKAKEMGYNIDDYLRNQQTGQTPKKVDVKKDKNTPQQQPVVVPEPEKNKINNYTVKAFSENNEAKDLNAFGYNIFTYSPNTFQPSVNIPVPPSYVLGPGDELVITLFGESPLEYDLTVQNNGDIDLPEIGPVNVNGLTLGGAKNKLFKVLSKRYSTLSLTAENGHGTGLDVNTGKLRTVKIYVLGEVNTPGGYTLPSLSTSFTALYYSGGPTLNGSLRNIQVLRQGKVVSQIDLYDYLLNGDKSKDVALEDEDIIFVPPVGERAAISGKVFRPAVYELKKGERLLDLIKYSGGLNFDAYFNVVHVERVIPFAERSSYENNILNIDLKYSSVDELNNSQYKIEDGDVVDISGINRLPENRVTISGYVKKPGTYELTNNSMTVRDLIYKADSLKPEAFLAKAVLIRTLYNEKKEIISFDLKKALAGNEQNNLVLRNLDEIKIYNDKTFFPTKSVEIRGAVKNPGIYSRYENMTLTELLILSGGLTDSATTKGIEITRMDTLSNDVYSHKIIVEIPKNYWIKDKKDDFILQNFDRVLVKTDPAKTFEKTVSIHGEVQFPGSYSILHEGEKIYDFIKRAGGFKKTAYEDGIFVKRHNKLFEKTQNIIVPDSLLNNFNGRPIVNQNILDKEYSDRIPIIWEDVEEDTNSIYNISLEAGDELVIPKDPNVVYVMGEVGIPSTVPYKKGSSLSYYIEQSGGYLETSSKGDEIVIQPNGKKWSTSGWFFIPNPEIKSGTTIFVPGKMPSNTNAWPVIRDVVSVLSTSAVLILTVINLTK